MVLLLLLLVVVTTIGLVFEGFIFAVNYYRLVR